jgi:predicted transcriptional regulator of viral defense system
MNKKLTITLLSTLMCTGYVSQSSALSLTGATQGVKNTVYGLADKTKNVVTELSKNQKLAELTQYVTKKTQLLTKHVTKKNVLIATGTVAATYGTYRLAQYLWEKINNDNQ